MNDSPSVRAESAAQLALMLGVGSVAACASWSHVVDLAEQNGQPGWLAVADAAVLETLAVSMGLDVRRRRRNGESTRFALCVLVAAVVLQLAAQVAQAPVTFWGWTMAALPAVGFLLLVKVAMTRTAALPAASSAVPDAPPAVAPMERAGPRRGTAQRGSRGRRGRRHTVSRRCGNDDRHQDRQ
jgi:peptidoglycan/LPS O-acetylase OafA/YrhL